MGSERSEMMPQFGLFDPPKSTSQSGSVEEPQGLDVDLESSLSRPPGAPTLSLPSPWANTLDDEKSPGARGGPLVSVGIPHGAVLGLDDLSDDVIRPAAGSPDGSLRTPATPAPPNERASPADGPLTPSPSDRLASPSEPRAEPDAVPEGTTVKKKLSPNSPHDDFSAAEDSSDQEASRPLPAPSLFACFKCLGPVSSGSFSSSYEEWIPTAKQRISDDVWRYICTFLKEEELFNLRGLCAVNYKAYFNQSITAENTDRIAPNLKRIIKLAKMGRIFARIEALDVCKRDHFKMSDDDLRAINAVSFPRLRHVWLRSYLGLRHSSLKHLAHPSLAFLQVCVTNPDDLEHVTPEKFPKLKNLVVSCRNKRITVLKPHPNLRRLSLRLQVLTDDWAMINKQRFPRLSKVRTLHNCLWTTEGVRTTDEFLDELRTRLLDDGVRLYVK